MLAAPGVYNPGSLASGKHNIMVDGGYGGWCANLGRANLECANQGVRISVVSEDGVER